MLIMENREDMKAFNDVGMTSSIMWMSLENRFKIRPRGVVSKNDIGDRRTFLSILLWRVLEAKMLAMAREKAAKRINNA